MHEAWEAAVRIVVIGVGATALMDLWAAFARRALGIEGASWGLVGRWAAHIPRGRFVHESIAATPPVRGERVIGWVVHYAVGVLYGGILVAVAGLDWARSPTPLPALAVGLGTVLAPLLILQPGMGLGVAAAKAPKPNQVRLRAALTHTIFGLGLYVAAALSAALFR